MNFICKGKNSKLKISNLFTRKVLIYLQKIRFLFTLKINSKNKTFLDFIKRILVEFEFIKEKSFNLIFYSQRNDFGLHFIKKTRFHNYKETLILFLEK